MTREFYDRLQEAAAQPPRQALATLAELADDVLKPDTPTPILAQTLLDDAVRHYLRDPDDLVTPALYAHSYLRASPHLSFSKGFIRRMAAPIKAWAKSGHITPLEWSVRMQLGSPDPLAYLTHESERFDAIADPDKTLFNESASYFTRAEPYKVLGYDTKIFAASTQKETNFDHLEQAWHHVRSKAYYQTPADRILFRRAQFEQNATSFHAAPRQENSENALTRATIFLQNMAFIATPGEDRFYATALTHADRALVVLGHEKIHQLHMRRYMIAQHEPHARKRMGMTWHDVQLTTASLLASKHKDLVAPEHNHMEKLAVAVMAHSVMAETAEQTYRLA